MCWRCERAAKLHKVFGKMVTHAEIGEFVAGLLYDDPVAQEIRQTMLKLQEVHSRLKVDVDAEFQAECGVDDEARDERVQRMLVLAKEADETYGPKLKELLAKNAERCR